MSKDNTDSYITRFRTTHGDKYDYPDYIRNSTHQIEIECPHHGTFVMMAYRHLTSGCPHCGMGENSPETFLKNAIEKYGYRFDYDLSTFTGISKKMAIYCHKHNYTFWQAPSIHLKLKHGCPKCGDEATVSGTIDGRELFIEKAFKVHGDMYLYDKVIYINSTTPVEIYCNKHQQSFFQEPASHLRGRGCPLCGKEASSEKRKYTSEEFLQLVRNIFGDKWGTDKCVFVDMYTKVTLTCKLHGDFQKNPRDLVYSKTGCPICAGNVPYTTEKYIEEARKVHGDLYVYEKTICSGLANYLTITCRVHGDFIQKAQGHLLGYGCPKCNTSKGELAVSNYLDKIGIKFVFEYCLPNSRYRYDFYLPEYHVFIEFHGRQHYEYIEFFHRSREEFESRKITDDIKKELVKAHKGKLIVIHYKVLDRGLLEKYLNRQLIRHGVPSTAFTD